MKKKNSVDAHFKTDKEFIKLIENDEDLLQEYLTGLREIRKSVITDEDKIVAYYRIKTGIPDIRDLNILELMRLSAFITLVRHCPNIRLYLPDFDSINVTEV